MILMSCGVLLLGGYALDGTASEKSTDTTGIGTFPHVDPNAPHSPDQGETQKPDRRTPNIAQSPDEGGAQKSDPRTEFEKTLDRCKSEGREVLSDPKLDVYSDGKNRKYGSDRKVRWLRHCMELEGYALPRK